MKTSALTYEGVTKLYDEEHVAVRNLNMEVSAGELVVLIGPSGCGKTTTLQMTNRIVETSEGRILLRDEDIGTIDPVRLRRRMGYVIQEIGLFPHMTVEENISVVPELEGWDRVRRRERTRELMELVNLDPDIYLKRYPRELSGGQQQRIGVLRALAVNPEILLMDEPFGALDRITRDQLQDELKRLQEKVQKTIIFVTHDMDEAIKMADRIALMRAGRLVQYAPPRELLRKPSEKFVSEFMGADRMLVNPTDVKVRDVMTDSIPLLSQEVTPREALRVMRKNGADYLAVFDDARRFAGLLSADRLQEGRALNGEVQNVERFVKRYKHRVDARASLVEAVHHLAETSQSLLPVIDHGGRFVGVFTRDGLAEALTREIWPREALAVARHEGERT